MGKIINNRASFIEKQKTQRLGEERLNYQDCLMKIILYNKYSDIMVEFQDKYKTKVHTNYESFKNGHVKNPYCPSVYGVGIVGAKYSHKNTKEYRAWTHILYRCFSSKYKKERPTYKNITCCEEWFLFDNFYEWLHSQENFDKWLNGIKWDIDKDILVKGNNTYSPDTCCLVPHNVNMLFRTSNVDRNGLPIGVNKQGEKYRVVSSKYNSKIAKTKYYLRDTIEEAFQDYKQYKESLIKQTAKEEFNNGNISKQCYDAMMNYEVEITD